MDFSEEHALLHRQNMSPNSHPSCFSSAPSACYLFLCLSRIRRQAGMLSFESHALPALASFCNTRFTVPAFWWIFINATVPPAARSLPIFSSLPNQKLSQFESFHSMHLQDSFYNRQSLPHQRSGLYHDMFSDESPKSVAQTIISAARENKVEDLQYLLERWESPKLELLQ